jgi:phage-related protein
MLQSKLKQEVFIDPKARKELLKAPRTVQKRFRDIFYSLEERGELREPEGKKLKDGLFEARVRYTGAWRGLYAYQNNNRVIVLKIFRKQTQKTPKDEIKTALSRLNSYK